MIGTTSATRVDLEASLSGGVYTSERAVPLQHLVFTVNAAQSGSVVVRWTGQISPAPTPTQPAASVDRTVSRGQTDVVNTGLATAGVLYIADAQGGSFDVTIAADQVPIDTAAVPPSATTSQQQLLAQQTLTGFPAAFDVTVAIDNTVHAVAVATGGGAPITTLTVTGVQSGLLYISQVPANGIAVAPVLSALDQQLRVQATSYIPVTISVVAYHDEAAVFIAESNALPVTTAGQLQISVHSGAVAAGAAIPLVVSAPPRIISVHRLLIQWAAAASFGGIVALYYRPSGLPIFLADASIAQPWVTLDFAGFSNGAPLDQLNLENPGGQATGSLNFSLLYAQHV